MSDEENAIDKPLLPNVDIPTVPSTPNPPLPDVSVREAAPQTRQVPLGMELVENADSTQTD